MSATVAGLRRWRIRRTPTGSWAVNLHVNWRDIPDGMYAPMGTWPTWAEALAWIERVAEANYGRSAA